MVSRFHAITALARAPPAEVPTRRMSFSAFSCPPRANVVLQILSMAQDLATPARTSASISIFVAVRGRGPSAGANSSAPMPRVPV